MKRTYRKYPSNYIGASTGKIPSEYPDFIYYPKTSGCSYKYKATYLHEANPDHYNMEGMYYRVVEICEGCTPYRPVTQADIDDIQDIAELDVYSDGFVGYKGNGNPWLYRLNQLGRLVNRVII